MPPTVLAGAQARAGRAERHGDVWPDRQVLQPSEVLRKRAILVERGSFRPPTHVNIDMLQRAKATFEADPAVAGKPVLELTEITMRNLLAGRPHVDRRDLLARLRQAGH